MAGDANGESYQIKMFNRSRIVGEQVDLILMVQLDGVATTLLCVF